jgi:1-deoxy-D-xylulose-5-phosphate reductoisomerase
LGIEVLGLSANSNIDLLVTQIEEFKPRIASVGTKEFSEKLSDILKQKAIKIEVQYGVEGLNSVAQIDEAEMVLVSVVGSIGLIPTIKAIRKGKTIALANKETLVTAGKIVMEEARNSGIDIIPVDSEHSAIFQSMLGYNRQDVSKIILTASGGPFRGKTSNELQHVTLEDALKHPNWNMGSKITIDSATMMNKGLEVIEARWLFDVSSDMIEVVVHPQSIIHSMVEYQDGTIMAQLGSPDMRIPIQFACTYPDRFSNCFNKMDILKMGNLTFEEPDIKIFKCLKLAFDALVEGGTMPTVLNAANEIAVDLFLKSSIRFTDIPNIVEQRMLKHKNISNPTIEEIIETDIIIRSDVLKNI